MGGIFCALINTKNGRINSQNRAAAYKRNLLPIRVFLGGEAVSVL
jgi:hypothetical protein